MHVYIYIYIYCTYIAVVGGGIFRQGNLLLHVLWGLDLRGGIFAYQYIYIYILPQYKMIAMEKISMQQCFRFFLKGVLMSL